MSGFVGVMLEENYHFCDEHLQEIQESGRLIRHRGSEYEGFFNDSYIAIAVQQSYSSKINEQPYHFDNDRYCIAFDGQIFNYLLIRKQLEKNGYCFQTDSVVEVLAYLFLDQGIKGIALLRGMFAFIIWDKVARKLYGARDPFGIKPLYYTENNEEMIVASEKKSLTFLHPNNRTINTDALQNYLSFQYVPSPATMSENIYELKPGHYFIKELNSRIEQHRYFHATLQPARKNDYQIKTNIQQVLHDSVRVHLQGKNAIGSFLSGGIDSSLVVAIAKQINPKIKTFSVGFSGTGYSEIPIAEETASKLGVEHYSHIITPYEYVDSLKEIMWHLDDPLADPACVPLYIAAREASKHVKVVLSGEGADEFFGGYNIYQEPFSLKLFNYIPSRLLRLLNRLAAILPNGLIGKSFLHRGTTPLNERYIGNAKLFEEKDKQFLCVYYNSQNTYQTLLEALYANVNGNYHPVEQMQYIDIHTWLPGDILLKADKMTAAHQLEIRMPFLDKDVFNVARSLPVKSKVSHRTTKLMLRKAAEGIVPEHVLNRKKLGFPVPIKHWLRNELYTWAINLFQNSNTDAYINKTFVLQLMEQHALGKADNSRKIWAILMFMLWHQINIETVNEFKHERLYLRG